MRSSIVLTGLLCIVLSSCGGGDIKPPEMSQESANEALERIAEMKEKMEQDKTVFGNTEYLLRSFTADGAQQALDTRHPVAMTFLGNRIVAGNCKNFRGQANIQGESKVAFSGLTYSKPRHDDGCPAAQVALETALFDAFSKVNAFTISEEGNVALTGGNVELTFVKK